MANGDIPQIINDLRSPGRSARDRTPVRSSRRAGDLLTATPFSLVDPESQNAVKAVTDWWLQLTGDGGEGMVFRRALRVFHTSRRPPQRW